MAAVIALLGAVVIGIIGWIMNLVSLVGMDTFSGLMVARIIGVLMAPLGAVLGFF